MLLDFKAKKFTEVMLLMLAHTHGELTLKRLETEMDRLVNNKKMIPIVTPEKMAWAVQPEIEAGVKHQHTLFSNLLDNNMINVAFAPVCSGCGFSVTKKSVTNNTFSFQCENTMCNKEFEFTISQKEIEHEHV